MTNLLITFRPLKMVRCLHHTVASVKTSGCNLLTIHLSRESLGIYMYYCLSQEFVTFFYLHLYHPFETPFCPALNICVIVITHTVN